MSHIGPRNPFSQNLHAIKYRADNESFDDYTVRYSRATADNDAHFHHLLDMTRDQRFLPAGRQQRAVGTPHQVTAFNCFVGETIDDSMIGIMKALTNSTMTMRAGGGIGSDYSPLRPEGERVVGLGDGAFSSGPISFMSLWDTACKTIKSGGDRRGALMAILRCDHPDIRKFIRAKRIPPEVQVLWDIVEEMPNSPQRQQALTALQNTLKLTSFNLSIAATDSFMEAVKNDQLFKLRHNGRIYNDIRALDLWSEIMEVNWDWAEPGIIFIDRVNFMNPLWYCETIFASNPCSEQMLPPFGACLLGSMNLVKYLYRIGNSYSFDYDKFESDIMSAIRAIDNVIDHSKYPLEEQKIEALAKRRMGLGYTAIANTIETMGFPYGTDEYIEQNEKIHRFMTNTAFRASIQLGKEKGSFPLFDADKWLESGFAKSGALDDDVIYGIKHTGLRNGLLISIAPTGTISLTADNVSSGGEPVFSLQQERIVQLNGESIKVDLDDYAYTNFGTIAKVANDVSPQDHIRVLCAMQKYTDSSISKTCNVFGQKGGVGPGITFNEFKNLYIQAYNGGAKGCTTFNSNGKRMGILTAKSTKDKEVVEACYFDPITGIRSCDE
jgi:ribonucleoside-diphosphate reductase alpha chain